MTEPMLSFECPLGGKHRIPGRSDLRVMKNGYLHFTIACDCGPEGLADADTEPHPTRDHLAFVEGDAPNADQWLRLDDLAEGWFHTNPHAPAPDKTGTWAQHRAYCRELIEDDARHYTGDSFEPDSADRAARSVPCPNCGADAGAKCQRPSGHSVRKPHAGRTERHESQGQDAETVEQAALEAFQPGDV